MYVGSLRCSEPVNVIKRRLGEFERLGKYNKTTFDFRPFLDLEVKATIETELAFCISTANSSALSGLKFQKSLEDLSLNDLSVGKIERLLKEAKVRFAPRKAKYIKVAIDKFDTVERALKLDDFGARRELLKLKGLGMKEGSHFLRNIGIKNLAIVDRHILRWLERKGYRFKLPRDYVKAEDALKKIAKEKSLTLSELDLMIWFKMTGRILK
ncbi:MAG: DNA lyase [Thermoplasmata archaeon]|nr:MAG: DNA lyase [Thermoplasmata archaeon]